MEYLQKIRGCIFAYMSQSIYEDDATSFYMIQTIWDKRVEQGMGL